LSIKYSGLDLHYQKSEHTFADYLNEKVDRKLPVFLEDKGSKIKQHKVGRYIE